MSHLDHAIRERAYAIWEMNGGQGCADEHWIAAERELTAAPAQTPAKPTTRRATAARKDAAVSTRKVRG